MNEVNEATGAWDINALDGRQLQRLIRDELQAAINGERGVPRTTQDRLALALGYSDQAQISHILTDAKRNLPKSKATILDHHGYQTSLGCTFEELVAARLRADERGKVRRRRAAFYDVFLASPMASATGYEETRNAAQSLDEVIQNYAGLRTYFAGRTIATQADFEAADIAWQVNRDALENSACFVLYLPDPIDKPSSIWVEAGMALAWQIPSIFFVPDMDSLPYILKRALGRRGGAEHVSVHLMGDDKSQPHKLVRTHRREFFKPYLRGLRSAP